MASAGRRIGRWLLGVAIVTLLLLPSLLVSYQWGLNVFLPVTADSLEFRSVELKDLRLGEKRAVNCKLRNRSRRTLHLLPPMTTCGCISLDNGSSILKPGESVELRFTFSAPNKPGIVEREIVLQAENVPNVLWKINIRGQALATVWAEPAKVFLETNDVGFAEATVLIHHNEATSLGEVRGDSPIIRLKLLPDKDGVLPVRMSVSQEASGIHQSGHATIDVMAGQNKNYKLLSIPVDWKPPSRVVLIPEKLRLEDYGSKGGKISRTILIRGLAKEEIDRLKVEPLETWVRVEGQDVVGAIVRVQLVFDRSVMPERIDQGILRLKLDDGLFETVEAYGKR